MTALRIIVGLLLITAFVLFILSACASREPDCTMSGMSAAEMETALVEGCGGLG